jgi:hypothetical protein
MTVVQPNPPYRQPGDTVRRPTLAVPSDTDDGTADVPLSRGVVFTAAGDADLVFNDGSVLPMRGVAAGTILPFEIKRVNAANVTATVYFLN